MPRYKVDVTYNMNFSQGEETVKFDAEDDDDARDYCREELEGGWLSPIKRGVRVKMGTLARII